ncbi:DUF418 domain-containing protein [Streptomonospora nanhaiensis]|uniref:DUF418 domain-containing protein n=1 Tax=Streptomonospora nanhaiensis TaxID=1323731 RepID=A0ABY6YLJ8_9ACTN|nr:DUF418 domain-containing protein [Streptomonospora nanhaiensis]WAE73153.1 DUF418 domain-containing protein [Streptomonospora nanhaiensis]
MTDTRATPTPSPAPPPSRGPTKDSERALAPDLARGAMLLLIALAHATGLFFVSAHGAGQATGVAERAFEIAMSTLVDARAIPMFAIMFGYGLVQVARRQDAATGSPRATRAILLRRNGWLVAFGLVHGTLLFSGEILGAYGVLGLLFTLVLLRRSDRVYRALRWIGGVLLVYVVGLGGLVAWAVANGSGEPAPVPVPEEASSLDAVTYAASVLARLNEWPVHTGLIVAGYLLPVWFGAWAARNRVLEAPGDHRRTLWTGVVGGFAVGVAGGLPMGLANAGVLHADAFAATWVQLLHQVSGVFGGIGYVSLFGLLSLALSRAGRPRGNSAVVGALAALGQRSLSGYLFQSVVWVVLASPYTLALGARFEEPTLFAVGCAVVVWLVSVVGADLMRRRSLRGPAEVLLRRLTYGRSRKTA